ncbi:MAG TPA: hypothetical protein VH637_18955 [Streptosporangiaceae bacterium]
MITSTDWPGSGIASIWPRRELHVSRAGGAGVGAGQIQHLLGHVQPVHPARGADPAG